MEAWLTRIKRVKALRWVRKMRGEMSAQLIETEGCAYVVKLAQPFNGGRRALVNEFIGSILLSALGVATPECAFVDIGEECGSGLLQPGVHFGSRYPGKHEAVAVYDFMPDVLLPKVRNREHFIGALMFDLWASNGDSRQAIFFRQAPSPAGTTITERPFVAEMIDHNAVFGGSAWTFDDSAVHYGRRAFYDSTLSIRAFDPWIDALMKLPHNLPTEAITEIPRNWIECDEKALEELLAQLYLRRKQVPAMIEQAVHTLNRGLPHRLMQNAQP